MKALIWHFSVFLDEVQECDLQKETKMSSCALICRKLASEKWLFETADMPSLYGLNSQAALS